MTKRAHNLTATICATLKGRWTGIDALIPRLERKTSMVIGRARLYRLLSVMAAHKQVDVRGRGDAREYRTAGT